MAETNKCGTAGHSSTCLGRVQGRLTGIIEKREEYLKVRQEVSVMTLDKLRCFSFLLSLLFFLGAFSPSAQADSAPPEQVIIYFFWGQGCPHCAAEKPFLEELANKYPQVRLRAYEIWYNLENRQLFFKMAEARGFEPSGVPTTLIGERVWIGFHEGMKRIIEEAVIACIKSGCIDPGKGIVPAEPETTPAPEPPPTQAELPAERAAPAERSNVIYVPLLGEIDLAGQALAVSTAIIAFVDGFNPCSLWVLTLLLALVIASGSRRKTVLVGLTFLAVTATVYGLLILGLFSAFTFIGYTGWVQFVVALLALTFASVNIKDYFWYKRGLSFTIPEQYKPKIYRDIRKIMASNASSWALIGATAVMALGIAIVEFPCTAGFPVVWTNLVAAQSINAVAFALLLGLYLAIYLLDELIVFFSVAFTLKMSRFEEKQGRTLKLIGGMIMLAVAVVLMVDPTWMNNITSTLILFGGAFLLSLLILFVHRMILPRYGHLPPS